MMITLRQKSYLGIALMIIGTIAMTAGSDIVTNPQYSGLLAIGGGATVIISGIWSFRIMELRDEVDERDLQITLRSAAITLWTLFFAIQAWAQFETSTDITIPVLGSTSVLLGVSMGVFIITYAYYTRVM